MRPRGINLNASMKLPRRLTTRIEQSFCARLPINIFSCGLPGCAGRGRSNSSIKEIIAILCCFIKSRHTSIVASLVLLSVMVGNIFTPLPTPRTVSVTIVQIASCMIARWIGTKLPKLYLPRLD